MDAICPACAQPLVFVRPGEAACPEGHGRAFSRDAASARLPREAGAALDHVLRRAPLVQRVCPVCRGPMARGEVPTGARGGLFARAPRAVVHACPEDEVLWLDPDAVAALHP